MGKITIKKILFVVVPVVIIVLTALFFRGAHISNLLTKLILPELSSLTGKQVMAQKITLNLFPLFIEAKEIKVFDEGTEIVHIPRVKGYIEASGLLRKRLVLRRITVKEPVITCDSTQVETIIENIKQYLEMERKTPLTVTVKAVVLDNGKFALQYKEDTFRASGVSGEALLNAWENFIIQRRAPPKISFSMRELSSTIKGWPELKGEVKGTVSLKDGQIEVKGLQVGLYGSMMNASGIFSPKGDKGLTKNSGDFQLRAGLLPESVKKIFGLKRQGEGEIYANGTVRLMMDDLQQSVVNMELKGGFYVQTLMELLKVKERVEGFVDFTGTLKGPLNRLTGDAKARLKKGNLFDIDVDELRCSVLYSNQTLRFLEGKADLYHGHAEAELTLSVSGDEYYALKAKFSDVDSPAVLTLIGWKPDIPFGKVKGEMSTSGTSFNPLGWYVFEASEQGKDVLGRIRRVKGSFASRNNVFTLSDSEASTEKSVFSFFGDLDLNTSQLRLTVQGKTGDLTDVTLPYRREVTGRGEFSGTVTGSFDNPLIAGNVKLYSVAYEEYSLGDMAGDLNYRKDLFEVKELTATLSPQQGQAVSAVLKGTIKFPESKELFDLKKPLYGLSLTINNADLETCVKGVYKKSLKAYPEGKLDTSISISGTEPAPMVKGTARIRAFNLYGVVVDSLSLSFSYDYRTLGAEGVLSGSRMKGLDLGGGKIRASMKDDIMLLDAALFNERVTLSGRANMKGVKPWAARLEVKSGRYDFLVSPFLKDVPEDLLINMKGYAEMSGDKTHFTVSAFLNQLTIALYGYNFSNESDIRVEMKDKLLTLSSVKMRSGSTSFQLSGDCEIGKEYNLVMEGSSTLLPLKSLSKKIDTIKGEAGFVFGVTGKWDAPKINGGVTVSNAIFGVRDIPSKVSSINGYLYMDGDRIVIQKLSGKTGGGDLEVSGVAYLKGFALKRFYLDAGLSNIGVNVSKEFPANFSGNLLYTGTLESQTVSGDIKINHAFYREPIEWQSWLLKGKIQERPRAEIGALGKISLNIKVMGSDNIVINNNMARASLSLDLVLRGTVANPLIFGRAETKTGIVYFRNNEFKILSATADFADPKRINPILNILAETSISNYDIRMNLNGQIEHFDMTLSSTPSLEETQILSLLTLGTLGTGSTGIQGGINLSAATSFLSGQLQDIAQERVKSITGIDRIGTESYTSRVTGKSEQRFMVSKRLIGDKLSVTYATSFNSVETSVIRIEYNVGGNVTLIGLKDESGGLGGNIKFRFSFK